jgi:fructose-specific component phosphotransferase system IIB-like protein
MTIYPADTFIKASGQRTVAAGLCEDFPGKNNKLPRRQFFITNLSTTDYVLLQKTERDFMAVPAAASAAQPTVITLETSDDIRVQVPKTASADVTFIVGELFPNQPVFNGRTVEAAAEAAAAAGGSSVGATSGSSGSGGGGRTSIL